jgi:hypothetical protein
MTGAGAGTAGRGAVGTGTGRAAPLEGFTAVVLAASGFGALGGVEVLVVFGRDVS